MAHVYDDRGYVQLWRASKTMEIRTRRRADYITKQMDALRKGTVLEIGCGTGEISYLIAQNCQNSITGIDLCAPFIEQADKMYALPNLAFKTCDFNDPESVKSALPGEKFDYVVGNGILHHLYYNMDNTLRNIAGLLNDGGKMIFLEPNIYNPYCLLTFNLKFLRKLRKMEPAEMAFSAGYIRKKLLVAGFKGVNVEYKDFLIPGTPGFMINPVISAGAVVEKIPLLKMLSQSIFISAVKS